MVRLALGTARGPQGVAPRDIENHPLPLKSIFFKVLIRKLAFSESFNDLTGHEVTSWRNPMLMGLKAPR